VWLLLWRLHISGMLMKQHCAAGVILEAPEDHQKIYFQCKKLNLKFDSNSRFVGILMRNKSALMSAAMLHLYSSWMDDVESVCDKCYWKLRGNMQVCQL
jgi:hypothetical protein